MTIRTKEWALPEHSSLPAGVSGAIKFALDEARRSLGNAVDYNEDAAVIRVRLDYYLNLRTALRTLEEGAAK